MTIQTPREAAEALLGALRVSVSGTTHHRNLFMAVEAAFAARDRALLASQSALNHPFYEAGYADGQSNVTADIVCAFEELLGMNVEGAWDAAEKVVNARRALLAEDEAVIEAMATVLTFTIDDEPIPPAIARKMSSAALAALRRHRGVE